MDVLILPVFPTGRNNKPPPNGPATAGTCSGQLRGLHGSLIEDGFQALSGGYLDEFVAAADQPMGCSTPGSGTLLVVIMYPPSAERRESR